MVPNLSPKHPWSLAQLVESDHSFSRAEIGPIVVVSLISALRLLGIFLILPIFSAYVVRYSGATLALAGIAFGIYALTQCIIQVPLGWASDRSGRTGDDSRGHLVPARKSVATPRSFDGTQTYPFQYRSATHLRRHIHSFICAQFVFIHLSSELDANWA